MKALITLLAAVLMIFAGVSILFLWVILPGIVTSNSAPLLLLVIALLVYLFFAFRIAIQFFVRRNQKSANAVAIMIGFHAWIFAIHPIEDFLKKVSDAEGLNGDFLIIGGFVYPLIIAFFLTWLLLSGIRLAYRPRVSEPGGSLNSESLRSSP